MFFYIKCCLRCSSVISSSANTPSTLLLPSLISRPHHFLPLATEAANCCISKLLPVPPSPYKLVSVPSGIHSSINHLRSGTSTIDKDLAVTYSDVSSNPLCGAGGV